MSDPRSKPKVPKTKGDNKAPHLIQAQAKLTAMKATATTPTAQVSKKSGRGS